MSDSCTFIPNKGADVFSRLRKSFGYPTAREIFLRAAINKNFQRDYEDSISLTSEGVVTYESLMNNPLVQQFIGEAQTLKGFNSEFEPMEDSFANYKIALQNAKGFNSSHSGFIATVESVGENSIQVVVHKRSKEFVDRFNDQYSTAMLNDRLSSMFEKLGVTVGMLSNAEQLAGRIGVTDFSNAQDIARGFITLIRVANNMEGAGALPEEFAHMIIGIFRNSPLVVRCINNLMNNHDAIKKILGNDFNDYSMYHTDSDGNIQWDELAEEALGHILRDNLKSEIIETPSPSLFRRMIDWIVRQFKNFSASDVERAIIDVNSAMNDMAKNMLESKIDITQEDIAAAQRNKSFNALSDRIDRSIEILKRAKQTEQKRDIITKGKISSIALTIEDIEAHMNGTDTAIGILNYAFGALEKLQGLQNSLDRIVAGDADAIKTFETLRIVKSYIDSYAPFVEEVLDFVRTEENEEDNLFDGTNIKQIITSLNADINNLGKRFIDIAVPAFVEYLKPFMGESFRIPSGKRAGEIVTVEDIVKEAKNGDISYMDMWLDSAANSSDTFVQLFNQVIQSAKNEARFKTLDFFKDIKVLRQKAEKLGLTTFEWMFEKDALGNKTGNYVSEVNYGEFERQRKAFEQYLNDKYGVNPSGEDVEKKLEERRKWREENCTTTYGPWIPNPEVFKGERLTTNQQQILDEFLALKKQMDDKYPESRVALNKAIQKRKSGGQRMLDSTKSLSDLFENIKESVNSAIFIREDDDALFGDNSVSRGLQDFDGREHLTLPVVYTARLANPDDLDTDVFGTLMSYAWATCHYEQMENIVDPLEVGRVIAEDRGKRTPKMSGSKFLVEKFGKRGEEVANKIYKETSNTAQRIRDLLECQVYGRYLKDGGEFEVFGKKGSVNKLASLALKFSSLTQLGFNWIANIANMTNGLCMQNIEAAARQYFTAGDLARADKMYLSELPSFMLELGARTKNSPLALFCELLNVKQEFGVNAKNATQRKNLLLRFFGENIAFLGQTAGDHWLYLRTAIAMAQGIDVWVNGRKMNLWEGIKAATKEEKGVKYVDREMLKNSDGTLFNLTKASEKIKKVNQRCFGIYNDDDSNAASRVALGRLLQQYRKWMKVMYNARFQKGQTDLRTDTWDEGYYRTIGRIGLELFRGERSLSNMNLSDDERYNLRRAITEIIQTSAIYALATLVEWPKDKKRPFLIKLAELSSRRLAHELGGLTPSLAMPEELIKTVKSPVPAISWASDLFNVINSALTPADWVEEVQSGPYKGYSKAEKNLIKAPIPFMSWYRQLSKFNGDLDTSIQYYLRPTMY